MGEPSGRQYWLWVTRPEYYLDEDGSDREILDLNSEGGWWTCHKDTKRGDLVFLWRTMPKSDIGYLIQAKSDAYSIVDENDKGWPYGCDYKVLFKFENPITIKDLRSSARLDEWGPFRGNFQRSVYRIGPEYWVRLNQLISTKNPGFAEFIEALQKEPVAESIRLEDELEEKLARDFSPLKKFGYDLDLYTDPNNPELNGRQLVCKGTGGRIDFLCYDKVKNRYVVVELKVVRAGQNTIGQILNYMGWVQNHIAKNGSVEGLVISRGCDTRFESALKITADRITQLDIDRLGFKLVSPKNREVFEHKDEFKDEKILELEKDDVEKRQRLKEARAWLKKGRALFDQGKYEEAIPCYDQAITLDQKNKWGLIERGIALLELMKYEEALTCFDKVIELYPKSAHAWCNKGFALNGLNKFENAATAFDKAIEIKTKFADAWNGKGIVLANMGNYEEAIKAYTKATTINPKFAWAWNNRGSVLGDLGEHEEAIKCFSKAIELDPKFAWSWCGKGNALYDQGKYDEAIKAFDKAIELDPEELAVVWNNKGATLHKLGRYEEAIKAYDRAIELDPGFVWSWNKKGIALCDQGKHDEAIRAYEKAIELDPQLADVWNNKGEVLRKLGRNSDAEIAFAKAKELGYTGSS